MAPKDGGLIKLELTMESNQLLTMLSSKSDQDSVKTELFSGMNTLVETNSESEFKTISQWTPSNGSSSTEELEPSDQLTRETMPFLTNSDKSST